MFDRLFGPDMYDWSDTNYSDKTLPSVNILENETEYRVELAAPGLDKNDFKLELNYNTLKISSEKKTENETPEGKFFTRREFSYQSFVRTFTLPQAADSDKIEAVYDKGILSVLIPKKEEAKPKPVRTIGIN